jgi:thioredoxin-related protein
MCFSLGRIVIIRPMKKIFLACLLIVLVSMAACSSDEKRGPSEDVVMTKDAFELIENARQEYVAKDIKGMQKYYTENAYKAMVRDVKRFESVELKFTPRWVDINPKGEIQVQVAWEGTWHLGEDLKDERDGIVTFTITGKPYKISGQQMTSPFAQPSLDTLNKRNP